MGQNLSRIEENLSRIEVKDWKTLNPGDHIYSDRRGSLYYHHGIYVGNYMVIHLQAPSKKGGSFSPCHRCGYKQDSNSGIIQTCLDCFLSGHNLYIYEYGVDPFKFRVKPRGSCFPLPCKSPDEVVKTATDLFHGNGFNNYDFVLNNCEDFAVYCKTGVAISMQACGKFEMIGAGGLGAYAIAKALVKK